jgi:hypothetical protein
MKKIYLLICTLVFSVTVNAQTKTFIAAHGSQWGDADNWSPLGLPGSGDRVIIDNNMSVYLDRPANVKCIALYNGASLVIEKPLTIAVESPTFPQAIYLAAGTTLEVTNTLNIGSGTTANIPTGLNINAFDANVIIKNGGVVTIDRCQTGAYIDGKLTVEPGGSLKIGQQAPVTANGIFLGVGDLVNNGSILIDNVQGPAVATNTTSLVGYRSVTNGGTLQIGNTGNVTGAGITTTDAVVTNSGNIIIDAANNGIQLTRGSISNTGNIVIGSTTALTGSGIVTSGTTITNSYFMSIKSTEVDGMQLTGGTFNNNGDLHVGLNNHVAGNCGGIGIHTNGTVINNNDYIDFGGITGNSMQLENASVFTNSGNIFGGSIFGGYPSVYTDIHGNLMLLDHSSFINTIAGQYYAYNSIGYNVNGIVLNNSGYFENRGTLKIMGPRLTTLVLDGNSDFKNYGFLEAYYGLTRSLYVAGGSLFENNPGGSVHFGATLTNGISLAYITGTGSTLNNMGDLLVNYGDNHGIEVTQNGSLLNNGATGVIRIDHIQQNGIEITGNGRLNNNAAIELNEITNIPLHVSGGNLSANSGPLSIGNTAANNSNTGILIEGANTVFRNDAPGQITVAHVAAAYNGIDVTTAALLRNSGTITWGTTTTAFGGAAALKVITGGSLDNRTGSSALEFVNCSGDAIATDASGLAGGSSLIFNGAVRFGNITGRGIYNTNSNVVLLNRATFETMPNGKMNLQASISNSGPASVLTNNDGTVTFGYAFSNKGIITNGGTVTNTGAFANDPGGLVTNNGTWNMTGAFNNNANSTSKGSGTFQGSVFNNAGTVAPGNSPGCLKMSNGFLNQSTGTLDIEVNGKTTACTEFDRLNVTGTATLTGSKLKVTFGGGYTGVIGDKITILKSTVLSGTFSSNNLPADWTVLYNTPATGDVTLSRQAPLPLTLLDFNVQKEGEKAKAFWTTTSEVNTAYFELERSKTGSGFERLATIPAMNTAGDHHYESVDAFPAAGKNYYRLRMADLDGQYTYSPVVSLNMGKAGTAISAIYPNPVKDIVHIAVTGSTNDLLIQIVSLDGKTILSKQLSTRGIHDLNVSALAAGIYFIKTNSGEAYKLIKQ